jgi:hypothetical protein
VKTCLAILPRELPETASSAATFRQMLVTSHASTGSTLRHVGEGFNHKIMFGCEEAVEEANSLWKGMEKK